MHKVVKVWDIDTGIKVFKFFNAHNGGSITTITLDDTGRKLIMGGQDGKIKVWNYSCIQTMDKGSYLCSVVHIIAKLLKFNSLIM